MHTVQNRCTVCEYKIFLFDVHVLEIYNRALVQHGVYLKKPLKRHQKKIFVCSSAILEDTIFNILYLDIAVGKNAIHEVYNGFTDHFQRATTTFL
jgi:hypothetical protein